MIELKQIGVRIGDTFPIMIGLQPDGTLFLQPTVLFKTIYDYQPKGISGIFDNDGFSLWKDKVDNKLDYEYNAAYNYKDMPLLKDWLIQQNLVLPVVLPE